MSPALLHLRTPRLLLLAPDATPGSPQVDAVADFYRRNAAHFAPWDPPLPADHAAPERIAQALADGAEAFATSFGYLEPALRVAADFPAVKFEHAGGYKTAANLNTYNARYYEARWLAGWLAGRQSTAGVAGYVAGFPVPEVVQGINAFTLGMDAYAFGDGAASLGQRVAATPVRA